MDKSLMEDSAPAITPRLDTWNEIDRGIGAYNTQTPSLPGVNLPQYTSKSRCLLDLPLDILHGIIKEITHTNDLTSLALTCSDLHSLVIPHIYTRFDIVWPDVGPATDNRIGVDALTYGLSTLVMSPEVFGQTQCHSVPCAHSGRDKVGDSIYQTTIPTRCTRRGNHFAQYTRKFSLGNGPEEWVREYLITKESGKMLGTLAAIAIGRMRNLESFHWDMPTGIVRDIWLALSSLAHRDDHQLYKLENVWVRWHDNRDKSMSASTSLSDSVTHPSDTPLIRNRINTSGFTIPSCLPLEYPTFSILPPVESLSVLDIDEISCIEEISALIERSCHQLRILRIGLAQHAMEESWAKPWPQKPPHLATAKSARDLVQRDGVLDILLPQSIKSLGNYSTQCHTRLSVNSITRAWQTAETIQDRSKSPPISSHQGCKTPKSQELEQLTRSFAAHDIGEQQQLGTSKMNQTILRLQILELERIYLSKSTLTDHIEWSVLESLTILGCQNTEIVWKALRRKFAPSIPARGSQPFATDSPPVSSPLRIPGSSRRARPTSIHDYKLKITKIHTDVVSVGLLAFIKDSLAPNTLEVLLLRQCTTYATTVTLEQIYKCAVRRHRASLKKLLIDGAVRRQDDTTSSSSRRWCFDRDLLTSIVSERLRLRELSMSLDYNDWHYFLQRLPESSMLRSLHVTYIANDVHGRIEPREAAQQILDVVALRPELQICFVGIHEKCFEILEVNTVQAAPISGRRAPSADLPSSVQQHNENLEEYSDTSDIDNALNVIHPMHDTMDEEISDDANSLTDEHDLDLSSDETDEEAISAGRQRPVFKLREILFYDDKITIFKARHGKL